MHTYQELKQVIHQHCQEIVNDRISTAKAGIDEVLDFLHSDSKSSAGDKHETSRAMAHLEMENRQMALQNLIKMHAVLNQFDPAKPHRQIVPGALLVTNHSIFYITISLGKITVNEQEVLVISYQAPIIAALKNAAVGSTATFNGNRYKIMHIT